MTSNWLIFVSLSIPATVTLAQSNEHCLDSVAVVGHISTTSLRGTSLGTLSWSMQGIQEMPQILGNSDPLHYLQMLPGVQTNSEHDAGLHIQGCDNGHNLLCIDRIPVYNPSHLMGLFSVFNPTHFSDLQLAKTAHAATSANRLGAAINVQSGPIADSLYAQLSIGLISSQGTLQLPTGPCSSLTASFRASYLNLCYGPWLKMDDSQLQYDFSDFNLTWNCQPSPSDQIILSAYTGSDKASMSDGSSSHLKWGNLLAGIQWRHHFGEPEVAHAPRLEQQLYSTRYKNTLCLEQPNQQLALPSSIQDFGYQGTFIVNRFTFGLDCIWHNAEPQQPEYKGQKNQTQPRNAAIESSVSTDYRLPVNASWTIDIGLRASAYFITQGEHYRHYSLDPLAKLTYQAPYGGVWGITYARKSQYVQQTGFSQIGFPIEFWFLSDKDLAPQYSHNLTLSHLIQLWDESWQLTSEVYAKRLYHQKEYAGNLMTLYFDNHYDLKEQLREGRGVNYGLNLLLNKRYGQGTMTLSYSMGRALRRFEGENRTFPASHERIHELNAVSSLQLSDRLRLGGTFVLSGGTPFTAPRRFYLLNDRLISQYGRFNADRLPPYHRLDLSLSYQLKPVHKAQQSLNFSIYNVYAQRNCVTYRLKISKDNRFGLRKVCMLKFPLPSVSYTLHIK